MAIPPSVNTRTNNLKKNKKIVIDDGLSFAGGATGIANYSLNLYQGLRESLDDDSAVHLREYRFIRRLPLHLRRLSYLSFINTTGVLAGSHLVHYTNYYAPLIRRRNGPAYVVTIHDMAAWAMPAAFSSRYLNSIRPIVRRTAFIADAVITVSQTVKEEIIHYLQVPEEKVHVCHNIVGISDEKISGNGNNSDDGHILFVGVIDVNKNVSTLVRAFARLARDENNRHVKLVLAGKKRGGFPAVEKEVRRHRLEERVLIPGYVEENRLMDFYANASVLVMPSVYEGFGIPAIEAMSRGIPVVASDIPVFREVAGDAALFYGKPARDDLLADVLREVLESRRVRQSLINRGRKQARLYKKENFIKRHVEVYRELICK